MRQRWALAIAACGVFAACKHERARNRLDHDDNAPPGSWSSMVDHAPPPRPPGALRAVVVDGVSGTAFFAPDGRSFWVQDLDGGAMIQVGLDGRTTGRVALDGPLEEASLWIRTSMARRPVAPDGHRLLESRTETDDHDHSAFVVDLEQRTETALPVGEYAAVDWLADGRLLVEELHREVAILDLASGTRTPICGGVTGLASVELNADGASLLVSTDDDGVWVADLDCRRRGELLAGPRTFPLGSPHQQAWIARLLAAPDPSVHVIKPSVRTVGPADLPWAAWLDDDRFVFLRGGVALWTRAATAPEPMPVSPPPAGCRDEYLSGAPGGGAVVIGRGCGEGRGAIVIVTP